MTLIEQIYRQRVEFLKRGITEPDLLFIPFDKEYEFFGELHEKYMPPTIDKNTLSFMGMKVIFIEPSYAQGITVSLSAGKLANT